MGTNARVMREGHPGPSAPVGGSRRARRPRVERASESGPQAPVHDFVHSEGLPRSAAQALEAVCGAFARATSASLAAHLRSPLQVSLLSLDQLSYDQFLRALPDQTVIALAAIGPLPGHAILELDPALAFWMTDRLLGGDGQGPRGPRPLTQVERAVIEGPVSRLLTDLGTAWQDRLPAKPKLVEILDGAAQAQIAKPTDAVAVASFEVSAGSLAGTFRICIPTISLKLASLDAGDPSSPAPAPGRGAPDDAPPRARLTEAITSLPVQCTVRLGVAEITAAELARLEEGDVLCLNTRVTDPLDLLVGSAPKLHCRPRTIGGKLAVEVLRDARE